MAKVSTGASLWTSRGRRTREEWVAWNGPLGPWLYGGLLMLASRHFSRHKDMRCAGTARNSSWLLNFGDFCERVKPLVAWLSHCGNIYATEIGQPFNGGLYLPQLSWLPNISTPLITHTATLGTLSLWRRVWSRDRRGPLPLSDQWAQELTSEPKWAGCRGCVPTSAHHVPAGKGRPQRSEAPACEQPFPLAGEKVGCFMGIGGKSVGLVLEGEIAWLLSHGGKS